MGVKTYSDPPTYFHVEDNPQDLRALHAVCIFCVILNVKHMESG